MYIFIPTHTHTHTCTHTAQVSDQKKQWCVDRIPATQRGTNKPSFTHVYNGVTMNLYIYNISKRTAQAPGKKQHCAVQTGTQRHSAAQTNQLLHIHITI